jgi:DUF2075 family protein
MILYNALKSKFIDDVLTNQIEEIILDEVLKKLGHSVSRSEIRSWQNSLGIMERVINSPDIPDNSGIAIEFNIPSTSKRIDFVLTGYNETKQRTAVIIELKQWETVEATTMDAIVYTYVGGAHRELNHPSYQAWSYAAHLEDYNEAIEAEHISLKPCAYLHNCTSTEVIHSTHYQRYTNLAPSFLKADALKLRNFLCSHVKFGDCGEALYLIEDGVIRPSKHLADSLESMLRGNQEFILIDDQKLVFENALRLVLDTPLDKKNVLIVEGGPGTGKSVVAINLLVALTGKRRNVRYVSKNAAPRAVYASKLSGSLVKSRIANMFDGSGSYTNSQSNTFDALIIDEAHRLNEKSGLYQNLGENQIKELINAANVSVFFIDEDQRVTLKDIGEKAEIRRFALEAGAEVQELALESQFRCNGSDGYLAWLDNLLGIRNTGNTTIEDIDYKIEVCQSPNELKNMVEKLNERNNKARMVAGYCWDWSSKKNPKNMDIVIPEFRFSCKWNLSTDGSLWILKPESVKEVGCIHTCQGLDLDYVGVIMGLDLVVRNGIWIPQPQERSSMDRSIQGWKKLIKEHPVDGPKKIEMVIKNTYRTLMTRGLKGCFLFSVDPETNEFLELSTRKTCTNIS